MPSHKLAEIRVSNFKSCDSCSFPLTDFTALVGYNNAGKSNLLQVISWVLKPSSLGEADFRDPARPIVVEGIVTGISESILNTLDQPHRKNIEPYCQHEPFRFRRTQLAPGGSVKQITLEVRTPKSANDDADGSWALNPTGIDKAIKALFPEPIVIEAMDDAAEDIAKNKAGTTIARLILDIIEPIQKQYGAEFDQTLLQVKAKLDVEGNDRAEQLRAFDTAVNAKVRDLFPGIELRVHVPTPLVKDIFKQATIKVRDDGDGEPWRDVPSMGHGAQRSIQMALIRQLAESQSIDDNSATRTLMLIDEPELYLHPQGVEQVRTALRSLATGRYQVVFATHSPLMIGREDIADALVIRKTRDQGSHTKKRLSEVIESVLEESESQTLALLELGNASQILFADRVIVAEGRTEERVLPPLHEKLKGATLGYAKVALVSAGGSGNTVKCLRVLEAMSLSAKAVADLDFAFRAAVREELIGNDDEHVSACKQLLSELATSNGFCLGPDGLPQRQEGSSLNPAEAFAILAADDRAKPHIAKLHGELLHHGIWLWTLGSIEHHLGIQGKGESAWGNFTKELRDGSFETVVADHETVRQAVEWLTAA